MVSVSFVGKMSHSLAGKGYDRGLDQQKYRVDYWDTDTLEWTGFIPARSGSQPFGKYSMGTRWTSIKGAGALPKSTHKLKLVLSGSINTPTYKTKVSPLYAEWFADAVAQILSETSSLTGDTLVRMADRTEKLIADIKVGDKILTYDPDRKSFGTSSVKLKKKRYANSFYNINGNMHATPDHPFFVSGGGIMQADELKVGDNLLTYNETYEEIETVEREDFGAHIYNMSLDGIHTYFANDILTHNAAGGTEASADAEEVIENFNVSSPQYPYTELSFDNLRVVQDQPRIEMSSDGFLLYQSEVSYLKMTPNSFLLRTPSDSGMGVGNSVTSQMDTTNTGVFGQLTAPVLQPYDAEPTPVNTSPFAGGTDDYARGDHRHELPFSTLDTVIGTGTVTDLDVTNLTFAGGGSFNITGSMIPGADDTYNIGSPSKR